MVQALNEIAVHDSLAPVVYLTAPGLWLYYIIVRGT